MGYFSSFVCILEKKGDYCSELSPFHTKGPLVSLGRHFKGSSDETKNLTSGGSIWKAPLWPGGWEWGSIWGAPLLSKRGSPQSYPWQPAQRFGQRPERREQKPCAISLLCICQTCPVSSVCGVIMSKTAEDQTDGCCEDFGYALGRVPRSKGLILHINSNVSLQGFSVIKNIPMRVFWGHCCAWKCCARHAFTDSQMCKQTQKYPSYGTI